MQLRPDMRRWCDASEGCCCIGCAGSAFRLHGTARRISSKRRNRLGSISATPHKPLARLSGYSGFVCVPCKLSRSFVKPCEHVGEHKAGASAAGPLAGASGLAGVQRAARLSAYFRRLTEAAEARRASASATVRFCVHRLGPPESLRCGLVRLPWPVALLLESAGQCLNGVRQSES